jgi:hypothetical protein
MQARSAAQLILLLAAALCLVSCGSRTRPFASPFELSTPLLDQGAGLAELLDLLQTRAQWQDTLWASGEVILRQSGVKGKAWFNATILYSDPDRVRLRGSRVPVGTLFEVILNGSQAAVHLNRESELYVGTLEDLRRQGGMAGAVSLREMMAAILVNQDLRRRLEEETDGGRWWKSSAEGRDLVVEQRQPDGRRISWRLRRRDALVTEIVTRTPEGAEEVRVTYDGYLVDKTAGLLPTGFTISLAAGVMTVEVNLGEYKGAPTFQPAVWMLPKARTRRGLEALSQRESPVPIEAEDAAQE